MLNAFQRGMLLCLLTGFSSAFAQQPTKKLSLIDALRTAVEQNLEIELQRVTVDTSGMDLDLTQARFEPVVTSEVGFRSADQEPSNNLQGEAGQTFTQESGQFNTSLDKNYDFGLGLRVSFNNNFSESDSQDAFPGKFYGSGLTLSATQELLRGFSLDKEVYKRDEYVARANVNIAREDLALAVDRIAQQTENAYWDLVLAIENLKVAEQSLELAKELYRQNKVKIEVGTLAPIELVNTEATVAERERAIVSSENTLRAAEDALKKVMNLPPSEWRYHIEPTEPLKVHFLETELDSAMEEAKKHRPEITKEALEREKALLEIKFQKNQQLPQLSVSGSYNTNGTDISDVAPIDENDPTAGFEIIEASSLSDAWDEVIGNDFPGWSVSLNLSWTPWNKAAKLNSAKARASLRSSELRNQQNLINIYEEVRSAVRDLEANNKSIKASEKTLRFREENLKAEEQKFQNGLSTNYRVAEVQDELAQARSQLISSKVDYLKSVASYYKALGTLTKRFNIEVK
jgi:outer membrane protein TolC